MGSISATNHEEVLITYFNSICRSRIKRTKKNIERVTLCLRLNNNPFELQNYMQWYCRYKNDQDLKPDFEECIQNYIDSISLANNYIQVSDEGSDNVAEENDESESGEESEDEDEASERDKESQTAVIEKKCPKRKKDSEYKSLKENNNEKSISENSKEMPITDKKLTETQPEAQENYDPSLRSVIQSIVDEEMATLYEAMIDKAKEEVSSFVENKYGDSAKPIRIEFDDDRPNHIEGEIVNEALPEILNFMIAKEPVYLVGPAGCGKNHVCKQVAKILELPFYFSNAITQEYKLTGFTDANGIYHETQFYKSFKNGGVFLLDELDASLPDALVILNAAISNGYFDFPAPVGYVEAHPDFRVIAAGNTWGNGADIKYVGRNQLDMASLDRFAVVKMDYSSQIETALCPDEELRSFITEYRKGINNNGIMSVVSYRAYRRMYLLEGRIHDICELLDSCLCKGLCKDDLMLIYGQITRNSKYKDALKRLADNRSE